MRNKLLKAAMTAGLFGLVSNPILAETIQTNERFAVTFTKNDKMENNFTTGQIDEFLLGLQPGDTGIIEMDIVNQNKTSTEWYMNNEVVNSLEDGSIASGGAYAYTLTYQGPEGRNEVIYTSSTIGGEEGSNNGLKDATDSLDDWFYLDTLKENQTGKVRLEVQLDGETQGNRYQSTLADLQMEFAVEKNENRDRTVQGKPTVTRKTGSSKVNTSTLTNQFTWSLLSALSGIVLLVLAIFGWKENKEDKDDA